MSENYQSPPFFGTESALQPSLPVLSNSTHSERMCDISRVSTPAVSLAWFLPPTTSTSLQLIPGRAYLNPHTSTAMLVELTDQMQNSTSALFYPGALKWDLPESKDKGDALQEFNTTISDQDTALSSLSPTAQWDKVFHPNTIVPFHPTLLTSFVQVTPPSYQDGSHMCHHHNSLNHLILGEPGQQPYSSVSYPAREESAPQPETVMVEKETQTRNLQKPISTSDLSAQNVPDNSLLVLDTEVSLGLPPSGQIFWPVSTEVLQLRTPPVSGYRSLTAPIHSPSEILAVPPAPGLEQRENENMHGVEAELSMPRDAYEDTKENQDLPHLPLVHPDCTDSESLRQKSASDNASLGGVSVGLEEKGALDSLMVSTIDFEEITTLEADNHLPQLFKTLKDIDQDPPLQNWRVMSTPSDKVRKNDLKASDLLDEAPQAKIQLVVEGEGAVDGAGHKNRTTDNISKHLKGKVPKDAPRRHRRASGLGQRRPNGPENNSKKTEELKQSRNRVKAEEKATIPKTKRKRNPPELSHDSFKKPRTHLGMHMLESVQVFHPLGKRSEKKPGISSFRGLRTFTSNKDPKPGPATLLDMPRKGQGPDRSPANAQRAEASAHKECPSQSQYELPPPGKVRLVPLPFPTLDKPQARPVSRKPLPVASHRSTAAYPVRPHSHSDHPSQSGPANTALMPSAKPAPPVSSSATRPNAASTIQSSAVSQAAYMRPVPYTSFQREPVTAPRNKAPSPPKPQTQYLLQDFSRQPIPWRKVDILGPVVSQPITKEQRPEREAMKRRAQQERENAAKKPCPGKLQLFLQREEDMEISQYYGYAM